MNIIENYINDGEVQRTKIALDVADGSISVSEIRDICADQRIKNAFIGSSYDKKQSKEKWDASYLDQVVCAAAAENFNQDYLLYLSEVGAYTRSKKPGANVKMLVGIVAAVAIVAVIIGIVIWKASNTGQ